MHVVPVKKVQSTKKKNRKDYYSKKKTKFNIIPKSSKGSIILKFSSFLLTGYQAISLAAAAAKKTRQ